MKEISSTQNEYIKALRALHKRKGRQEAGLFLAEGRRTVQDALRLGKVTALLAEKGREEYASLLEQAENAGADIYFISPAVVKQLAQTQAPEGIFSVAALRENMPLRLDSSLTLLCERLQDPGNLGTVVRTAEAVGAGQIVLSPDCADIYNAKTLRACMGAQFSAPLRVSEDFYADIARLQQAGMQVTAALLEGEDYFKAPPISRPALLIGNEGNGLTERAAALADMRLRLPMHGQAESLNAAVAAGVLLYDLQFRNRKD